MWIVLMGGVDNALPKQNCLLGLNVLWVGLFFIFCNLACGAALCPAVLPYFLIDKLVFVQHFCKSIRP